MKSLICLAWLLAVPSLVLADDELTPDQQKFFETKIRPVLVRECYSCHSTKVGAVKGGLWLDTREGLLSGGDSGPAIVPKNLDDSMLWSAINHIDFNMPPRKKLSDQVLRDFKTWIEMGAPDPRSNKVGEVKTAITTEEIERGRSFWSFSQPSKPPVPTTTGDWAVSDIDHFILAQLEANNLVPNEDADATTVLRRLTFAITGLPPTPEQVDWFVDRWESNREQAIEEVADSLLATDHFGERWGRHWLDVARYAESSGREQNLTFPHAWRYRDYVIDSFNKDKPYDQFVQEQLAGDLLPVDNDEEWAENLVATGFLALGPKTLTEQNARQFENDLVDEQIDVTTRVMLGVSVACARCHDHKFDPIPQTDYYAMAGIFKNTSTHYGTVNNLQNRRPSNLLILPIDDPNPFDKTLTQSDRNALEERLQEKQALQRQALMQRRMQRSGNSESNNDLQRQIVNTFRTSAEIGAIEDQLNRYDENGRPYSYCMGVQELDRPTNARLLERGEFDKPAQEVPRGFPQVLSSSPFRIANDSSGRLELAQWIGSANNPLTARVMVNRVFLHLMGNGIVRTPENFGATGQPATHPELLDHLACRFMENGWSVKQLVREIVTSRAFRVSSQFDKAKFGQDPENKLLWRYESRRLDAEALRDSILAVSGQLQKERPRASLVAEAGTAIIREGSLIDISGGGAGSMRDQLTNRRTNPQERRRLLESLQSRVKQIDQPVSYRSVYLPIVRDHLPRSLEVFDFAEPTMVVGDRDTSNTPDQGLYFLNNEFVIQQCDAMAERLIEDSDNLADQLKQAFLLAYGRPATVAELNATKSFCRQYRPTTTNRWSRSTADSDLKKLSAVCQAILASAEFRYID